MPSHDAPFIWENKFVLDGLKTIKIDFHLNRKIKKYQNFGFTLDFKKNRGPSTYRNRSRILTQMSKIPRHESCLHFIRLHFGISKLFQNCNLLLWKSISKTNVPTRSLNNYKFRFRNHLHRRRSKLNIIYF